MLARNLPRISVGMYKFDLIVLIVATMLLSVIYATQMKPLIYTEFFDKEEFYCEAHQKCFLEGKAKQMIGYMVGKRFDEVVKTGAMKNDSWINIHSLLHNNYYNDDLWIYGEDITFSSGQTGVKRYGRILGTRGHVAIVRADGQVYREITENKQHSFACSFRLDDGTGSIIGHELFRRGSAKGHTMESISEDSESCYNRLNGTTEVECALKCHLDKRCRSVYYSDKISTCIHTLYVDSILARSDWSHWLLEWRRNERQSWSLSGN
ncbi:hypothetical protein FGIG_10140 [Fasciola gigantica]|uniref:Apple domain-containing protein n=1 Tax=Fasciola gigantica TaxID=46835 RepID=A0A504Y547_FASGI|nr:hypothetical protein FGIG_10140 [Fasciola gigantica]